MTHMEAIHRGDRIPVLATIGDQASELYEQPETKVTCPCGIRGPVERMFRCFYCEIIFCELCAEDHFKDGRTP